jgi:alkanesulfonate monooxygenase SsuD/methylene tetrahydromethanopterin reductase-like flavin-dependent oxidoreductase (luciferase family)
VSPTPRVGVMVPTFRDSPSDAIALAVEAERLGIDGVFVYDHLWPMGRPDRPALAPFPLLGAIAARTSTLYLGTLVARVGVTPAEVLVSEFMALDHLAPGRVIAALGTGDHLSFNENLAYGLVVGPAADRREMVRMCAAALLDGGLEVWVGGLARPTVAVAEEVGAIPNFWQASFDRVAEQGVRGPVTWSGMADPHGDSGQVDKSALTAIVEAFANAGATWTVFGWPVDLAGLAEVARSLG